MLYKEEAKHLSVHGDDSGSDEEDNIDESAER